MTSVIVKNLSQAFWLQVRMVVLLKEERGEQSGRDTMRVLGVLLTCPLYLSGGYKCVVTF